MSIDGGGVGLPEGNRGGIYLDAGLCGLNDRVVKGAIFQFSGVRRSGAGARAEGAAELVRALTMRLE
jgi:hypothetical protein